MATSKTNQDKPVEEPEQNNTAPNTKPKCGIIMPIAGFPPYTENHWSDVLKIIKAAAEKAGFDSAMVSTGNDIGVIHANIINNIYSNEIAVCDVSGKNPNVMFELGLRLASKLPVIIIKDELTGYSFDTSPIQHLPYRSDLRMFETIAFQDDLTLQIKKTHEYSLSPNYRTFLDHFGSYTLSTVEDKAVGVNELLSRMDERLSSIEYNQVVMRNSAVHQFSNNFSSNNFAGIPNSSSTETYVDNNGNRRRVLIDSKTNKVLITDMDSIDINSSRVITKFWCDVFDCNEKRLRDAVNAVGNDPGRVKAYLSS